MIMNGNYPLPSKPDVIPVNDGAGEVVEVGADVQGVAVGDRVSGSYFPYWVNGKLSWETMVRQFGCTLDGMLAEYAIIPAQGNRSHSRTSILGRSSDTTMCCIDGMVGA